MIGLLLTVTFKQWEIVKKQLKSKNTTHFCVETWFCQLPIIGLSKKKFTLGSIAKTYPQNFSCKSCCWSTFSDKYLGNYIFYILQGRRKLFLLLGRLNSNSKSLTKRKLKLYRRFFSLDGASGEEEINFKSVINKKKIKTLTEVLPHIAFITNYIEH